MASCFQPKESLLVTNVGFEEGEHYWEFITPINCNGMQLGVVETGYDLEDLSLVKDVTKIVTLSFRTTTPRVIGKYFTQILFLLTQTYSQGFY